tara:strand:- start:236 stop:445 length:210 start_codon:yes stop_codon:yes gene_type:complete
MTLDVLIKEDKVVFVERYPTVAVMFEPGLKPNTALHPYEILVFDHGTMDQVISHLTQEFGFIKRLNLMS